MKSLVLLLSFIVFTALHTHAQINSEKLLYLEKAEKYRKMKGTGRGLVFVGSAATIIGFITMINAPLTSANGNQTSSMSKAESGAIAYVLGNVVTHIGIPLWIVGGVNEGRYNRKADALAVRWNVNPQGGAMSLTYRIGK